MVSGNGEWAGREGRAAHVVTPGDLAGALGSGDVPVLATPRVLAWFEEATVAAIAEVMPEGKTSVGVTAEVDHVAPSPQGAAVTVSATVRRADHRTITFDCEAMPQVGDAAGRIVAQGTVTRALVDRETFLSRLP